MSSTSISTLTRRLPPAVEVCAYFVIAEALANVQRHARASHVTIRVEEHPESLVFSIADDGVGGAMFGAGSGLTGARDRVDALGGTLVVSSPPAGPTILTGTVPFDLERSRTCLMDAGEHVNPLRVVLADDAVLVREGVARLLAAAGMEIVGQAGDAVGLLAAVDRERPDVAIVDIRMPPTWTLEGLEAARRIRDEHPSTSVLLLSTYVEAEDAMDLLSSSAGGVGYLLKDSVSNVEEFVAAVRRVAGGGSTIDPSLVAELFSRQRRADPLAELTAREREVLVLMAQGRSNAGIATRALCDRGCGREVRQERSGEARDPAGSTRSSTRPCRPDVPRQQVTVGPGPTDRFSRADIGGLAGVRLRR